MKRGIFYISSGDLGVTFDGIEYDRGMSILWLYVGDKLVSSISLKIYDFKFSFHEDATDHAEPYSAFNIVRKVRK